MGLEDRLNEIKKDVIDHMNNDHSDANLAYVKGLSELHNATSAKLIDVDQLGITLLAETPDGWLDVQLQFLKPLQRADDIRPALVKLVENARGML